LLGLVAIVLARESGALLVGERTNGARIRRLETIIRADESVNAFGELFTMQLGPDQVLLAVDGKFRPELTVRQLEPVIDAIEACIRKQEPAVVRVFIEADSLRESSDPSRRSLEIDDAYATGNAEVQDKPSPESSHPHFNRIGG
jgi:divalent metal cation (Fe/Co/Zn/Cd) transporter